MPKVVGVIGIGSIGSRHAKNLIALRGNTVLTHDPKNGDDDNNLKDLLKKSDAIVIASPTPVHYKQLMLAMPLKKPIFIEKPIAASEVELAFLKTVQDWGRIMVGYNLRFHSCVIQAKAWIEEGFLGKPLWSNLTCAQMNTNEDYRRDGVILNWSHEIDLALYLLGPGYVKAAATDRMGTIADIVLLHKSLCQSSIHLDYLTLPEIRQTLIVGDHSTIILDLVNRQAWVRNTLGTIVAHHEGRDTFDSNYKDEIETFLARADGKETVGCSAQEGLDVLQVCCDARRLSAFEQRAMQ